MAEKKLVPVVALGDLLTENDALKLKAVVERVKKLGGKSEVVRSNVTGSDRVMPDEVPEIRNVFFRNNPR